MDPTKDPTEAIDDGTPKTESAPRSSHCYDAIEVHTEHEEPQDLLYALDRVTEDWVDAGQACGQTTLDLADACRRMVAMLDLWQWMIDMRSRIDKDSNITRSDIWVFLDVDDCIISRGDSPLKAIANARRISEGVESTGMLPRMDCENCQWSNPEWNDGGHCYMFKNRPPGDRCGQFKSS